MERVFAALIFPALLFAARVNNSSAYNPFPRRRLPVLVGPMLLKYTRGICNSVHKEYGEPSTKMAISRRFRRRQVEKNRFVQRFLPERSLICTVIRACGNVSYAHSVKPAFHGVCFVPLIFVALLPIMGVCDATF